MYTWKIILFVKSPKVSLKVDKVVVPKIGITPPSRNNGPKEDETIIFAYISTFGTDETISFAYVADIC